MNKVTLIVAILCAGFILTSCEQTTGLSSTSDSISSVNMIETDVPSNLDHSVSQKSAFQRNTEPPLLGDPLFAKQFLEDSSDEYLLKLLVDISYVHANSFSQLYERYVGFQSPDEISSSGLMNFFLGVSNGDAFLDSNGQYMIPVKSICVFLDQYFEAYTFIPEDVESVRKELYDPEKAIFCLPAFAPIGGMSFRTIENRTDNGDGTVTITIASFDAEMANKVATETLILKVMNDTYFYQSYHIEYLES